MNKPQTIDELIGRQIKKCREDAGRSQEMLSLIAKRWGLNWSRSQVAQIESGRRSLAVGEWFVLPMVLSEALDRQLTYLDLIPENHDAVAMTPKLKANFSILPQLITYQGDFASIPAKTDHQGYFERPTIDVKPYQEDVVWNAARRFKVSTEAINKAAEKCWRLPLSEERDRRLTAASGESSRTLQARRGHTTRELFTELERELVKLGYLKQKGGKKRSKRGKVN